MSSFFNLDMLQESYNEDISNIKTINENESYFLSTLSMLKECDLEYINLKKNFYRSVVVESGNVQAINESFNGFITGVKKIIEKVLKFIKDIFAKFILTMNKIVKSDKYITKHKKDLDKIPSDAKVEMKVFKYSHLSNPDIPVIASVELYKVAEPYIDLSSGDYSSHLATADTFKAFIKSEYDKTKDSKNSEYFNQFRARVIGKDGEGISQEDYAKELFKLFRNNNDEKEEQDLTVFEFKNHMASFEAYDELLKSVTKAKTNIEKIYKDLKNNIDRYKLDDTNTDFHKKLYDDTKVNNDVKVGIKDTETEYKKLFAKLAVEEIDQISKIHSLAFAAKLDAVKECYKQDKDILYKAFSLIYKKKKEDK